MKINIKQLNSNGDRQHPCLRPVFTSNQSVFTPLIRTHDETELYKDLIALNILPFTPTLHSLFQSKFLLTVS